MACDITAGRVRPCKDSLGGNKLVYLFNAVEDPFTILAGEATAINVLVTEAFKYELEGDGNILDQSMPSDRNTFSKVNTQTITLVLKVPDAATNAEFNLLVAGFTQAVMVDRNGNHYAVGIDDFIDWTVVPNTGGAKADLNGYTLTGLATVKDLAPILDAATVTALEALVV